MGVSALELCNKYSGKNCSITSDASSPMVPTAVVEIHVYKPDHWYGPPAEKKPISDEYMPCAFGMEQPLQAYYTQNYDMDDTESKNYPTLPEQINDLTLFPLINNSTSSDIVWEYRPQVCILKPGKCYVLYPDTKTKYALYFCQKPLHKYALQPDISTYGTKIEFGANTDLGTHVYTVPYESYIEHVGGISHGFCEYGGGVMPSSFHIGVIPVHSWLASPANGLVQPVVKFSTCIEI